ncbi:L-lactate dehydrogenase [Mesoplasma corruscae]|uniref:L-lactate dehydrogenase n=1 Tax=Mesoplasma corruscae TaxID=216874 RepID=A0A2S5RHF6_9MOLU|nr:L-lactate dehydrogenase [Mesoplasma corruscae]PPE06743.1 L-lactate dehydrogenase [Mesoplasma corruscae]
MKKTSNKIVLVGTGAVGMSFIYSAVNQGIAEEYVLIDVNTKAAEGNAIDIQDAIPMLNQTSKIKAGEYSDCQDADLVVITAGRPQRPGETRLELIADNARIMKGIAQAIKGSGFTGVTLIASNPCDVLTSVYQEVTGFDKHKVLGSGTNLDSARLKRLIASKLGLAPASVNAFIMGEHGDSSLAAYSASNVMGKSIHQIKGENKISEKELEDAWYQAVHMAYEIIERKGATFYGIGASLTQLSSAILRDEKTTYMISAKLEGEYGQSGFYTGVPAVLSSNGWERIIEWKLEESEIAKFNESCNKLQEVYNIAKEAIK